MVGRKERERVRLRFLLGEVKGAGVIVESLLVGFFLGGLLLVGRGRGIISWEERDAYKPMETDLLRNFNGRSSSEPDGTYI